jgi:choline-sulfatase
MCSPSRASLLTGYFPAQHGVKWTLETNMTTGQYPRQNLPLDFPNIGCYSTPYRGKFHVTNPAATDGQTWVQEDVDQYGFEGWNPPDAGANQLPSEYGGGAANNDGRYMASGGQVMQGQQGVVSYLQSRDAKAGPFSLVVSLVNPHDVLGYPKSTPAWQNNYTAPWWFVGDIDIPATASEDLSTKPSAQREFLALSALGFGPLNSDQEKRNYINFYGNLMKLQDSYLVQVLDTLEAQGLLENTLIVRSSDHGEMGMAHGGLRQKNFNFYEESLRVPLIFSNPKLYPSPVVSPAMVSHVDMLPTLASLFNAPDSARAEWRGKDYADVVLNPAAAPSQRYVVFTYDDYPSGQASPLYPRPNNHIVSIREERYKLAKYYDAINSETPCEWEMYDLETDPLETKNLAHHTYQRSSHEEREFLRLQAHLTEVQQTRLQPIAMVPPPPVLTPPTPTPPTSSAPVSGAVATS